MLSRSAHRKIQDHARQRAAARYGLELRQHELDQIRRMVRNNEVLARVRITGTRSLVLVRFQDKELMLVYSNKQEEIVTFLPPDDHKRKYLEAARRDK